MFQSWIIMPVLGIVLGIGLAAFAIWNEFSRQRKALDVLRIYAEKGQEPPPAVLAVLDRASVSDETNRTPRSPWARFAFFLVMSIGFGLLAAWFSQSHAAGAWLFVAASGVTCFVMAAVTASALVSALRPPRVDG